MTARASSTCTGNRPAEISPVDAPSPRRSNVTTPIPAGGRSSWRWRYAGLHPVPSLAPCSATTAVSPAGEYIAASTAPSVERIRRSIIAEPA